ncbi:MAG: ribulose-phosphate 3-epimerase [Bacteroidales bacterium]|jgi:ribulose-phosphate 3-epimerase|nr:ribulose-phosphate 3-epimerase [Bacteroidales bacterium]
MHYLIAPSLLSADFGNLQRDISMINQSKADWFHLDIMDGNFVPNLSIGFPVLKAVVEHARKPLDIHLMIVNPDRYIERFCTEAKANYLTVHYEACTHLHRTVQNIKSFGVKAGVSLNPHSPVSLLEDIIEEIDLVLLMSVNPGFGGQQFIKHTYKKIERLKNMIRQSGSNALIEVDGGVDLNNYKSLIDAGVDVLVCGNTVFSSDNPIETIAQLKS